MYQRSRTNQVRCVTSSSGRMDRRGIVLMMDDYLRYYGSGVIRVCISLSASALYDGAPRPVNRLALMIVARYADAVFAPALPSFEGVDVFPTAARTALVVEIVVFSRALVGSRSVHGCGCVCRRSVVVGYGVPIGDRSAGVAHDVIETARGVIPWWCIVAWCPLSLGNGRCARGHPSRSVLVWRAVDLLRREVWMLPVQWRHGGARGIAVRTTT